MSIQVRQKNNLDSPRISDMSTFIHRHNLNQDNLDNIRNKVPNCSSINKHFSPIPTNNASDPLSSFSTMLPNACTEMSNLEKKSLGNAINSTCHVACWYNSNLSLTCPNIDDPNMNFRYYPNERKNDEIYEGQLTNIKASSGTVKSQSELVTDTVKKQNLNLRSKFNDTPAINNMNSRLVNSKNVLKAGNTKSNNILNPDIHSNKSYLKRNRKDLDTLTARPKISQAFCQNHSCLGNNGDEEESQNKTQEINSNQFIDLTISNLAKSDKKVNQYLETSNIAANPHAYDKSLGFHNAMKKPKKGKAKRNINVNAGADLIESCLIQVGNKSITPNLFSKSFLPMESAEAIYSDKAVFSEPAVRKLTSKYRGVCWYKRTRRWVVQVKIKGVRIHIGYFLNEEDAAESYKRAIALIKANPNIGRRELQGKPIEQETQ